MSVQAMAWAMEQRVVTDPPARHVLLALANYAGEDGRGAFPAVSTLCDITGLKERTVKYKLAALEEAGVIRRGNQGIAAAYIARGDRRPVVYDLNLTFGRGAPRAPRAERGAPDDTNGVHLTTERGAPHAPDPPINHQGSKKQEPASPSGSRLAPDWVLPPDWREWAERERPDVDVQREADSFADYWHGLAGAKARKADWLATWRNWIRRAEARRGHVRQFPNSTPGKQMQGVMTLEAMKNERLARSGNPVRAAAHGLLVAGKDAGR